MYRGDPINDVDFYNALLDSDEFSAELGRVTLAAGRLEAELMLFLNRHRIKERVSRLTLGQLIATGKKSKLLDDNLITALEKICKQRNYLTHNIYALFIELIDETILERRNLQDSDIQLYVDRASQLRINMMALADIIKNK